MREWSAGAEASFHAQQQQGQQRMSVVLNRLSRPLPSSPPRSVYVAAIRSQGVSPITAAYTGGIIASACGLAFDPECLSFG